MGWRCWVGIGLDCSGVECKGASGSDVIQACDWPSRACKVGVDKQMRLPIPREPLPRQLDYSSYIRKYLCTYVLYCYCVQQLENYIARLFQCGAATVLFLHAFLFFFLLLLPYTSHQDQLPPFPGQSLLHYSTRIHSEITFLVFSGVIKFNLQKPRKKEGKKGKKNPCLS